MILHPEEQHTRELIHIEIDAERSTQDLKWGEQNHPNGTGIGLQDLIRADNARIACDLAAKEGNLTWKHILHEEVLEAFAENDPAKLRAELMQVIAVGVAWVEAIDRAAEKEVVDV
jgi:hypothetical protein